MNCKYMNMLRVVRGNAFKLKIAVEAYTPSGRRIDSFALGEAVLKLDKNGTLTTKDYTILEGTTILVAFDGSESLGVYGFQMSGEYEGEAWRWANAEIFQIVETNAKANIPDGCVLLDDTYNMALKIVLSGGDGITFTPSVSEQGIISWTNDGGLPNPEPRNIRGPRGEQGPQGEVGPQGPRGQMGLRGQIGPKGDKGDKGDTGATPVLDVTASVDENVGNPMVVVESFGPAEHRTFDFQFKNLKGQKGETGATGPQGPQGQQGEPGNYTKPASGIPLSDLNGNVASGIVYDVTANNSGATFASLSALLSSGSLSTLIPTSVRKGGMQIRFVCSSDNKYVQYRYMPSDAATVATFTNTANWQGVDVTPTADSSNLVESGGTYSQIKNIKDEIDALFQDRDGSSLYITDIDGNVIAQVDRSGVHSVDVEGSGRKMSEMPVPLYDDALYIADKDGNVILTVDANGIRTIGFDSRGHFSPKFKSIQIKATIEAGESLKSNRVQIEKDIFESALIQGEIENVLFGLGMNETGYDFYAHWLEITSTEVKLYRYANELQLVQTYSHGITLTNKTVIVVDSTIVGNTKETTLKLYNDLGDVFTQSLPSWGVGACFVTNQNTSDELDVSLSLMPKRLASKIWLFGDSYINFISNVRWPYYLAQLGHLDFFSNNCPGLSPSSGLASLEYILGLGYVPSILVWCLGMNGNGVENIVDGEYVINQEQKTVIDSVLSICKTYGITPILSTIPTVPNYQKTGLSNYVRSLGVRYIDFADAVGADSSGNWNEGLLSDDNVHPSALGAIVLASRVFADCPELTMI